MYYTWLFRFWLGTICVISLLMPGLQATASEVADLTGKSTLSVTHVRSRQSISTAALLADLKTADVIYLGETHDRAADHLAQQSLIQRLHQQRPKLAIGMEMFQRPVQFGLNQYLRGESTEAELRDRTDYQRRWGYDWEFYAPILRFAKTQQLPVIALNTPTEVTRKVARTGLDSLNWADRRFIPPRSAIFIGPDTYRQRLEKLYTETHQGTSNSLKFAQFFQAQVLWDETMAERIAQFLQQQPDTQMVVLVGQGHLLHGEGIPQRVARRRSGVRQISVLLNPAEDLKDPALPFVADYFWEEIPAANPDRMPAD